MKRFLFPALASGLVMAPLLRAEALWEQSKRMQQQYNVVQREREYAQRVIDTSNRHAQIDRAFNNRASSVGNYWNSAREQTRQNWDDDYEMKPLTAEQTAKIEEAEKARMAVQARIDAEMARRERDRQEMLAIVAKIKERAANEEVRRANLDELAKAGNVAAASEVAALHIEYSTFTPLELDRIHRAGDLGDLKAIAKMLTLGKTISADETSKWETTALIWGEPIYSMKKAKELAQGGDRETAAELLEKAFARNPDARTAAALAGVRREQGRTDEAISALRSAMTICEAQEKALATLPDEVRREIFELPVTSQTGPRVLHLLMRASRVGGRSGAPVHLHLGDIFSGREETWRGVVPTRGDFRSFYERAVELNTDYHGVVAERLVAYGDFDGAEKFFEAGVAKRNARTVLAAGYFWVRRTDGKADGRKAVALLGRVAPEGDLQRYAGIAAECGDILRQGRGMTAPDIDGALHWYNRGHRKQEIESTRRLAAMIYAGEGLPKDEEKALAMLDEVRFNRTTDTLGKNQAAFDAAVFRFMKAMKTRGGNRAGVQAVFEEYQSTFYGFSERREPDPRALEFYGRALVDGDIHRDYAASVADGWRLLERAAALGNLPARAAVEFRKLNRHEELSADERAVVFQRLLELAETGEARGAMGLGVCYREGIGSPVDADKALYWLQRAAAQGLSEARVLMILQLKDGGAEQRAEAERLTREDAEGGSVVAQTEIGFGYLARSEGAQALAWFEKAGAQRYWPANYQALKLRYTGGAGVAADSERAFEQVEAAAMSAGDMETIYELALVCAKDPEVESFLAKPDYAYARELMSRAYDQKLEKAYDKMKEYERKL